MQTNNWISHHCCCRSIWQLQSRRQWRVERQEEKLFSLKNEQFNSKFFNVKREQLTSNLKTTLPLFVALFIKDFRTPFRHILVFVSGHIYINLVLQCSNLKKAFRFQMSDIYTCWEATLMTVPTNASGEVPCLSSSTFASLGSFWLQVLH